MFLVSFGSRVTLGSCLSFTLSMIPSCLHFKCFGNAFGSTSSPIYGLNIGGYFKALSLEHRISVSLV
jgi:hypothetical protein